MIQVQVQVHENLKDKHMQIDIDLLKRLDGTENEEKIATDILNMFIKGAQVAKEKIGNQLTISIFESGEQG